MSETITFNWEDVVVKGILATLPEKMAEWAEEVLLERAHFARDMAQILVRVETGSCRDSIRIERGGKTLAWRRISIRAGGYVVNPKTGRLVDYAGYLEKKYPYMTPAVDMIRGDLAELIKAHILLKATTHE
jgi:hypothetical protein